MNSGVNPSRQSSKPPEDWAPFIGLIIGMMDRWIAREITQDPELARRARLITRFGWIGSLFGLFYVTFYLSITHYWGAAIIAACSLAFIVTPLVIMRTPDSIEPSGNFMAFTLTLGYTGLCFVEGGLRGHAIAGLVTVPLCALLLVGLSAARRWACLAFFCGAVIAGIDLAGVPLPVMYDPHWASLVAAAGYLGLILLMFVLGLIFERGRKQALAKLEQAVAELASSNERLQHLNEEKNEFLGIAAHDLKNPLTAIAGSAELIPTATDPAQLERLSQIIGSAANRMRILITNLLDANAIEQGKFTSNVERCDIGALIEQSVDNNRHSATRKQIDLKVGVAEGVFARADRAATLQVFDNLLSNAVKYSPPNTTIHLHALPEKDSVLIKVRDEGPGINEADQGKLFQKFTRLTARPTGGESSTGLGLAISKRLLEAMGGSIQCHSTPGLGTTFAVRLPAWPEASATDVAAGRPALMLEDGTRLPTRN